MTETEKNNRDSEVFSVVEGHKGYLREAYHGGPYVTRILLPEAFADEAVGDEVPIPAKLMQERLGEALSAAMLRQLKVYEEPMESGHTKAVCESFKEFVALCVRKEAETGEPCRIYASY
ncbi:MAG TPA: hypothetical protein PK264_01860 [Hyphomicrobiaceae bacterium]|nr:hypothetical protein [Hyphomicrobiaceae bacterium]